MTITLPAELETKVKAAAARSGLDADQVVIAALEQSFQPEGAAVSSSAGQPNGVAITELLDWEYIRECAAAADWSVTLAEVQQALAKIPGSLTDDFRAERDER